MFRRHWHYHLTVGNTTNPWFGDVDVVATDSPFSTENTREDVGLPAQAQEFEYDEDGNLTKDGIWVYTWDADNRLSTMDRKPEAVSAGYPDQYLEFAYDYLGRRVSKKVTEGATVTETRFLYDGWNLIAEFDVVDDDPLDLDIIRTYAWGLDMASGNATGGIGALVQLTDHGSGTDYFPTYDGNGNLAALVNASTGQPDAIYEYTPYGEPLRAEGSYAADNPFRFSTKYTDAETGMLYYGYRYYDPANGRFLNRDPIGESGGINLYAFAGNDPVNNIDVLGMKDDDYMPYAEDLDPTLDEYWARQLFANDDAAEARYYALLDQWLYGIDTAESAGWFSWNQRRKRVLRSLTPDQRNDAEELQRLLYERRRRGIPENYDAEITAWGREVFSTLDLAAANSGMRAGDVPGGIASDGSIPGMRLGEADVLFGGIPQGVQPGRITIVIPGFGPQQIHEGGWEWSNETLIRGVMAIDPDSIIVRRDRLSEAIDAIVSAGGSRHNIISIYAYSLGGPASLKLAQGLGDRGIFVDNLVTIDPVRLPIAPRTLTVPDNVRQTTNHYQSRPGNWFGDFNGNPLHGPNVFNRHYSGEDVSHQNMPAIVFARRP